MTFEPFYLNGKYYRTRDGRKVRIYATDSIDPVHGAVQGKGGEWYGRCWTSTGRHFLTFDSPGDIIGPWIDKPELDWSAMPRWMNWAAMDSDGQWYIFSIEPCRSLYGDYWSDPTDRKEFPYSCSIPPAYAPKWEGDWKDSLIRRPENG